MYTRLKTVLEVDFETLCVDYFQKMDKNNDGVITIDEFLETCQRVI